MLAEEKVRQGGQGDDREGRQVRDRSCSANKRLGDGQMDLTEQRRKRGADRNSRGRS